MKTLIGIILSTFIFLVSCSDKDNLFDASGSFEAEETIISAETAGAIKQFNITEGQTLQQDQIIGFIDSTQWYLKKKQLESQINAVLSRKPNIPTQTASFKEQLIAVEKEQQRIISLVKANAATPKQLDDVNAQVEVLKKQINAQQSTLSTSSESISQETMPLQIQIEQINDQLAKCRITNPINGTVLTKYAKQNEVTAPGKPLYKIADISYLFLRAYISGKQLTNIKLNQKVKVFIDSNDDTPKEYEGTITWISNKSEFTPKTIPTKEERTDMVYAIKIKVINDGLIKIGMYGEAMFTIDNIE